MTVQGYGLDYAWHGTVDYNAIKATGARFVCRYLSRDPSKNLTLAEKNATLAAGLDIVLVWEDQADAALKGGVQGTTDANDALKLLFDLHMDHAVVYFAVDFDASPAQQPAINDYMTEASHILLPDATGIYGGYWPVSRALNAGVCKYAWQTFAWSGGNWDKRAQIQQYQNSVVVAGINADWNRAEATDYGQWPRPTVTAPKPVTAPLPASQAGWAFCRKCKGLFWGPEASLSRCPDGGTHERGTGDYVYSLGVTGRV